MTNEVFARTWKRAAPATEFWPDVMNNDLVFIAEAYWDMEFALMQQGFDACYDKRLYDRLAHEDAASVRGHLQADAGVPGEAPALHREPRRAAGGADVRRAGARGGGRDGDRAGRQALPRRPVRRLPHAHPGLPRARAGRDARSRAARLLLAARRPARSPTGGCSRCSTTPICCAWSFTDHVVVVNLGDTEAWGRVQVAVDGTLTDVLTGVAYERSGPELVVGLEPWGAHVFSSQSSS